STPATTTASFKQTLNVAVNGQGSLPGAGSGTVTATVTSGVVIGSALSCTVTSGVASGICTTTVTYGSNVVLNGTAAVGANALESWSGSCVIGTNSCTFASVTTTPAATTAIFKTTFAVAVQGQGAGAGAGSGTVTASVSGTVVGAALNCS